MYLACCNVIITQGHNAISLAPETPEMTLQPRIEVLMRVKIQRL